MHLTLPVRRLYVNVITTIKGFGGYLWTEVIAQIDAMGDQVNVFQNQAKKLPKVCSMLSLLMQYCGLHLVMALLH